RRQPASSSAGCGAMSRNPQESVLWTRSPRPPPCISLDRGHVGGSPAARDAPASGASRGRGAGVSWDLVGWLGSTFSFLGSSDFAKLTLAILLGLIPALLILLLIVTPVGLLGVWAERR